MVILIDLAIVAIVALCVWRGYKNGLIRGVFGVVSLIAALIIANAAANAYSEEFTGMLKPFVGGIVETTLADIAKENADASKGGGTGGSAEASTGNAGGNASATAPPSTSPPPSSTAPPSSAAPPSTSGDESVEQSYKTAYEVLRKIGLPMPSASRIADMTAIGGYPNIKFADVITDKLCSVLAFVAVFAIGFVLLAIIFAVIGNLVGFVFSLPGLKLLDTAAGIAFGILKGFLIVFTIATVMRYFGLVALSTIEKTTILNYIMNNNIIANTLGL